MLAQSIREISGFASHVGKSVPNRARRESRGIPSRAARVALSTRRLNLSERCRVSHPAAKQPKQKRMPHKKVTNVPSQEKECICGTREDPLRASTRTSSASRLWRMPHSGLVVEFEAGIWIALLCTPVAQPVSTYSCTVLNRISQTTWVLSHLIMKARSWSPFRSAV